MYLRHLTAALLTGFALTAQAVPITYEGTLISGVTVGGFISDPGTSGSPFDDFWQFTANQGDTITLAINRLNSGLDPAIELYEGIGADTSTLILVDSADDNYPELPGLDGPFADPFLRYTVRTTGLHTVQVWDFASNAQVPGGFCYQITLNGEPSGQVFDCRASTVPEPGTLALAGLALLGLTGLSRRRI